MPELPKTAESEINRESGFTLDSFAISAILAIAMAR
jgi:hypothetical protein